MNRISITVVVICALVAGGCVGRLENAPLDSPILMRIQERLSANGRSFRFACQTEKNYGCYNYAYVRCMFAMRTSSRSISTGSRQGMFALLLSVPRARRSSSAL
jgi:hypothetical protein